MGGAEFVYFSLSQASEPLSRGDLRHYTPSESRVQSKAPATSRLPERTAFYRALNPRSKMNVGLLGTERANVLYTYVSSRLRAE